MARPVNTKPGDKGKLSNGKKHLNASLPEQLVFDFNAFAERQGHGRRDALLEDILRTFLETVAPEAQCLRQQPSSPRVKHLLARKEAVAIGRNAEEQEAIRVTRQLAAEILLVTSHFITRKPPRRSPERRGRRRQAS